MADRPPRRELRSDDGPQRELRVRDQVLCEELDGELVALETVSGRLYRFNQTAAVVLLHCDGRHTEPDIVNLLVSHSEGATRGRIRSDVANTLRALRRAGLIE